VVRRCACQLLFGACKLTFGMFTFTFYELESSSRRSIRFGMRDAKNRNYESKHCCCCLHPPRTFFEGGKTPLQKRSNASSVECLTESVFFGRYRSVFLGIYHTDTEGKLGQYFRYQNFGGSPSKNWREPPFSQEGGASAPSLYTSPSF
jgi:hypothetical protein